MPVRTFVAVPIVAPMVVRALEAVQGELRRSAARVRWVPGHQFHFTLKFLGDVEAGAVTQALAAVARATTGRAAFAIDLTGIGAFPSAANPRVIWAGCSTGAAELAALAAGAEAELVVAGFSRERRGFTPHLTLGRVVVGSPVSGLPRALATVGDRHCGQFSVQEAVVFRSDLRPEGARHTPLGRFPLRS